MYTATFTLSQASLEAPIVSSVSFTPRIDLEEDDSVPAAYFVMSELVEAYLEATGVLDENGEFDEDEVHATLNIDMTERNTTKH